MHIHKESETTRKVNKITNKTETTKSGDKENENKKNETAIGHESGEDMETHLQHVIKQNETKIAIANSNKL